MGVFLRRCLRVAFPVLLAADILLVRFGIVSLATVALLEGVLLLVAGVQLVRVALRYRRERANGRDIWTALERQLCRAAAAPGGASAGAGAACLALHGTVDAPSAPTWTRCLFIIPATHWQW